MPKKKKKKKVLKKKNNTSIKKSLVNKRNKKKNKEIQKKLSKKVKKKNLRRKKIKKLKKKLNKPFFLEKVKNKFEDYVKRIKIKIYVYLTKLQIKKTKEDIIKLEKLIKREQRFTEQKIKSRDNFRLQLVRDIKAEERQKIYRLKDHLWKLGDRFSNIRERYKEYRQGIRNKQLAELAIRRQNREQARIVLEAEKAENSLKQELVERLERFSRNMKSIVFQINKKYITKKRPPLRFIDNISENGECLIKNDDAPTDKDYLILLYVEGEDVSQRLNNPICLDDKTDISHTKNFQPKNIFEASDYIIERLAIMFDKERKLKK
ncbi:MAG: hypothetical protein CMI73_03865 [Candidatus Pelagibacter sp.]|nr:hypothetical protein [Candidatus Pelagibacter sp.]OUV86971.1 MAG: hypothetical protein CBC96_03795 [Pelagibacteraceae bacterium TMED136]|tara:strand:- start:7165 stop:8124 length:960 start_codon:yes stop_codon:yes gene_type:complete